MGCGDPLWHHLFAILYFLAERQQIVPTSSKYTSAPNHKRAIVIRSGGMGDLCLIVPALKLLWDNGWQIELLGNGQYSSLVALLPNTTFHDINSPIWCTFYSTTPNKETKKILESATKIFCFTTNQEVAPASMLRHHYPQKTEIIQSAPIFASQVNGWPYTTPLWKQFTQNITKTIGAIDRQNIQTYLSFKEQIDIPDEYQPLHRLIPLFPYAGSVKKEWPLSQWIELAKELTKREFRPYFVIDPEKKNNPFKEYPSIRSNDLSFLAKIFKESCCCVGGDTGLIHLASIAGAGCVVLYGPTDPQLWQPPGKQLLLQTEQECKGCSIQQARNCTIQCLDFSVETILQAIASIIN